MKKLILLGLLSFSLVANAITELESPDVKKDGKVIGESYIAKFDSEAEKTRKIKREKEYLMSKDEFQYFLDQENDGVAYMASYSTPDGYTISFKGFCKDKYISVYGDYNHFEELRDYFLEKTKEAGCNF